MMGPEGLEAVLMEKEGHCQGGSVATAVFLAAVGFLSFVTAA